MFVGIQFTEADGGTISLVHEKWLTPRKKEVWWPPHKQHEVFVKSLRKGETPNEQWSLFKVEKSFFQEDNYQKASLKLKKAEVTSDVATDIEEKLPLKRPRKLNRKLFFTESSDESEANEPPPKKLQLKRVQSGTRSKVVKLTFFKGNSQKSRINWDNELPPKVQLFPRQSQESDVEKSVNSERENSPEQNIVDFDKDKDNCLRVSDFQKNLITVLLQIKQQNSKILNILEDRQGATGLKLVPPKDMPVAIPLQNIEDLKSIEEYLALDKNLSALASYCETLGGRDKVAKVNNILRNLLSNRVAAEFSFLGTRQDKRPFANLKLRKVVVNAVLSKCEGDAADIDGLIKVWLKHAPKRAALERKKKNKNLLNV
ncbi:unnamed protein product [Ceutorhynchus assimilis]|uniref:DUF4806 domain-containing protein n=1 Tax=Ceutorhynchus assimilis TaxID=467358 RepID=A0A9N9QQK2_9CUCU|nr:unnamed protein product [Ceutorhynchus assimilis]